MNDQRTIIIGDVHGCHDELLAILKKCEYDEQYDRLIFVGDLINKGPKSKEVLHFAMNTNCESVTGNHELGFLKGKIKKLSNELYNSLGHNEFEKVKNWLGQLPPFIEDDHFLVVHGGIIPDKHPRDSSQYEVASIRTWDGRGVDLQGDLNPAWYEFYKGDKLVVFGHWAAKGLVQGDNYIGLDTGCVYGGQLSAVILPERRIVQVDAFCSYKTI